MRALRFSVAAWLALAGALQAQNTLLAQTGTSN